MPTLQQVIIHISPSLLLSATIPSHARHEQLIGIDGSVVRYIELVVVDLTVGGRHCRYCIRHVGQGRPDATESSGQTDGRLQLLRLNLSRHLPLDVFELPVDVQDLPVYKNGVVIMETMAVSKMDSPAIALCFVVSVNNNNCVHSQSSPPSPLSPPTLCYLANTFK